MPPDADRRVSRETSNLPSDKIAALEHHLALLRRWQRAHNLVAPSTLDAAWERHVLDSAQLADLVPPHARRLLDLGSGAGFPGLVLAILLCDRPQFEATLVESNGRKCAFLRTVARELSLPVEVRQVRIEDLAGEGRASADVITARALAPLDRLCGLIAPLAGDSTLVLLPKGSDRQAEISEARRRWTFDLEERPSRTDPAAGILVLRHIARRNDQNHTS